MTAKNAAATITILAIPLFSGLLPNKRPDAHKRKNSLMPTPIRLLQNTDNKDI